MAPSPFPDRNAEIIRRRKAGEGPRSIAHALGLSFGLVAGVMWRDENPYVRVGRQRGDHNPRSKLNTAKVAEIRVKRASGAKLSALAAEYGVDVSLISLVARGLRWKEAA